MVPVQCALFFASAAAVADDVWAAWKLENGQVYSGDEDRHRRGVFEQNLAAAAEQQKLNPEAEFGATRFSDLPEDEFHRLYSKPKFDSITKVELPAFVPDTAVPKEVIDWQKKGAVTPVKDQGMFGTCWSFATSGTMEGQEFVIGGRTPVVLAEQMLIDCCSECYGHPDKSLNWILNNKGMDTSASYGPYKGSSGSCKHAQATAGEAIVSVQAVHHEEDFMAALQKGPFHIAIDDSSLQSYRGGVMTNTICQDPGNHDVLLVGAGEENGVKYWRVKNSWGTSFGESGYFRVIRDKNALCLGKPNSFGSEATTAIGRPSALV